MGFDSRHLMGAGFLLLGSWQASALAADAQCAVSQNGQWKPQAGARTLEQCAGALAHGVKPDGTVRFARWQGGLLGFDGYSFYLSKDGGETWASARLQPAAPVAETPMEAPSQAAAPAAPLPQPAPAAMEPPAPALPPPAEMPAVSTRAAAEPTASPAPLPEPEPEPARELVQPAAAVTAPPAPAPEPIQIPEMPPLGDATPRFPAVPAGANSVASACLLWHDGWIQSQAPDHKVCANLLDQSPETYDEAGYKYAYWQNRFFVATRDAVFVLDDQGKWSQLRRRYRY